MNQNTAENIIQYLKNDFNFKKESKGWLQYGKCPDCGKNELFIKIDNPWSIKCGRIEKCGYQQGTKELYPELFESFNKRFKPTEKNPNATADAYMQYSRGFDVSKLKGFYEQGNFWHPDADNGTQTVRFYLDQDKSIYMERFVEEVTITDPASKEKKKRKANFKGSHQGMAWIPPGMQINDGDEIWIVEACIDAIALYLNGIKAIASLSCVNHPHKVLEEHKDKDVTWVWALDNDNAGKRYTKKHVLKMEADGYNVTAAQVPAKSKCDWNDLHKQNALDDKDISNYKYHGELLIAKSAAEKALLMYNKLERKEFHFQFSNRLYWFFLNLDKYEKAFNDLMDGRAELDKEHAREQALKQANAIIEIANCTFKFLYFQQNLITDESWYYARITFPHKSKPVKNTFSGPQLSSSSEFKKRLLSIAAGSIFTGEAKQLDKILKDELFAIKQVQTIDYIGYAKEHRCYVFNDIAVKDGQYHELNDEDFYDINKLSIKTLARSPELLINTDREQYTTEWLPMLKECFGDKGIVALAFWVGSLFAEQIRDIHKSFPFIEIIGEAGAGKSTLIEFLWRLMGRADYEGFDPSKASFAARARNFVQVANLPIVLIESDRGEEDRSKKGNFDFDELKTAFNGRAISSRGVKNNGNDTYEPPFRGSIVISQNAEVKASEAVLQRIVHTRFTTSEHTSETKLTAEKLEKMPIEKVSHFVLDVLAQEKNIIEKIKEKTPYYAKHLIQLKELKSVRIAKNHAQMMALVDALQLVLPFSDEDAKSARTTLSQMAIDRQQAVNADHPVVQEFWETYSYLNEGASGPVLNHSKNDHTIAININHFVQVANDRKQQIPHISELKCHLKTSKLNKYLDQKTTNSAIHTNKNGDSKAVKCWRFSNPDASNNGANQ